MSEKKIIQPGTQAPDFTLKDQDEIFRAGG